jgi:hypothetical protein
LSFFPLLWLALRRWMASCTSGLRTWGRVIVMRGEGRDEEDEAKRDDGGDRGEWK